MEKTSIEHTLTDAHIKCNLYSADCDKDDRRKIILLHGPGIPGDLTWSSLVNYLTAWDDILIMNFPGVGESFWLNDVATPSMGEYAAVTIELIEKLEWSRCDIAGFSFGGAVAASMLDPRLIDDHTDQLDFEVGNLILIEPAMLFALSADDLKQRGNEYRNLTKQILLDPEDAKPFYQFMEAVAPHRKVNEITERLYIKKLQQNAVAFAQMMYAVCHQFVEQGHLLEHWTSPVPGISFLGERSLKNMHRRHIRLMKEMEKKNIPWRYESVTGADHSMVFSQASTIAKVMNEL